MNHIIGIFNTMKGSIFPVLQGQKKKKKEAVAKTKPSEHTELR